MKAVLLFLTMLIATTLSCFGNVREYESTPNIEMHGNVIQSCIVETFVKAVEHCTTSKAAYVEIDEIYVDDGNPLLTNEVIDSIKSKLKQPLIIVKLANLKSNPEYLRDKLTKDNIIKWDVQLKLYDNKIRVKVIPWGVTVEKKRGRTIMPHSFVDWYIGRFEYDCEADKWIFRNFEYGWI